MKHFDLFWTPPTVIKVLFLSVGLLPSFSVNIFSLESAGLSDQSSFKKRDSGARSHRNYIPGRREI